MAETAAHLIDHLFPPLPVRQWVLSVPKRLRYFLEREPAAVSAVLHIFLRVVETHLRQSNPRATAQARLGAVSFVHRLFAPSLGLTPSGPRYARPNSLPANLSGPRSIATSTSTAASSTGYSSASTTGRCDSIPPRH